MSAYALSASSFSIQGKIKKLEDGRKIVLAKIVMGDGSSTYPAGGIVLAGAFLALPTSIDSLTVIDNGEQGINYTFAKNASNSASGAFRGFETAAINSPESELGTGFTMPVHTILVEAIGW